jgi:small subunit ribosomal protein S8
MSMTDPIADMLTRIRNAQSNRFATVDVYGSKFAKSILEVLKKEGYIKAYTDLVNERGIKMCQVELKYDAGQPVISEIKRISKPGRRTYSPIEAMPKIMNGLGIAILSTSKGVMSDADARQARVGGEVICHVC